MIGGNTKAVIRTQSIVGLNSIGEREISYSTGATLSGWLDYLSGNSEHTAYDSKMQESTHVFICDYQELRGITPENAQMMINGQIYQIMVIDNPMNMNRQLEIYLKFVGGQNVS